MSGAYAFLPVDYDAAHEAEWGVRRPAMGKNGQVHFADETRQAALFEIMILAAGSDGDVSKVEVEEIYRRVFERPEFHGIHASDLRQAISRAAQHVSQAGELSVVLESMAQRLPDRPSRELAFGLAASVAWADRRSHPPELELLKALQKTFELDDADVARLYELAAENAPLPPTEAR
jgi:uncharacterized tellurite resistance protein B-like protein